MQAGILVSVDRNDLETSLVGHTNSAGSVELFSSTIQSFIWNLSNQPILAIRTITL